MTSWPDFVFGASVGGLIAIVILDIIGSWTVGAIIALISLSVIVAVNATVRVIAAQLTAREHAEWK